jgi:hypothetical protein
MLNTLLLAFLKASPDDTPKPKPTPPAAMVLDIKGKAEIRSSDGKTKVAEIGDLLYPDEVLVVPGDGSAIVSILGAGTRESIKPGSEAKVEPKGCTPPEAILARKEQPKAVASMMKNLRPSPGDGRKAGLGFRTSPDQGRAITPIFGATVVQDRPSLAWPAAEKAESYRVKLLTGAGRELWKAETKEPRLTFPEGKEPLHEDYVYRWEVTDQDYRQLVSGEFSAATASERAQFDELKAMVESGDRADRCSAALGYWRMSAYAEAIATLENLDKESSGKPAYRSLLSDLYRIAGRMKNTDSIDGGR